MKEGPCAVNGKRTGWGPLWSGSEYQTVTSHLTASPGSLVKEEGQAGFHRPVLKFSRRKNMLVKSSPAFPYAFEKLILLLHSVRIHDHFLSLKLISQFYWPQMLQVEEKQMVIRCSPKHAQLWFLILFQLDIPKLY